MTDDDWLETLRTAADSVAAEVDRFDDMFAKGVRPDQYAFDLAADAAVLEIVAATGAGTFSEESGVIAGSTGDVVVIDPVDGSTNASRTIPHFNTSLAVIDADGPRVALVRNIATGEEFTAIRGGGAFLDGEPVSASDCSELERAIVAVNGLPTHHLGWAQFRCFGAAALDIAYVAAGRVDAFIDVAGQLGLWDYIAGHLIAIEAGAVAGEIEGRDLLHRDHSGRRGAVYASSAQVRDELLRSLGSATPNESSDHQ